MTSRGKSAIYSSTDGNGAGYMSTDAGLTWKQMTGSGGHVNWVAATADKVYTSDSNYGPATIRHASQGAETSWTTDPPGMSIGGIGVGTTFDGTHHIVVAAQGTAGIWRYVEP